jgi:hypothetical protein
VNAIRAMDTVSLVCRASLVLLLIDAREDPRTIVAAAVVMLIAFHQPRIYQSPALWLGIGVPVLAVQLWRWEGLDDHVVLTSYWFCALGLALLSDEPKRALGTSARLLLGFTFACATVWKATSSEYVSGRMFYDLLLTDERFQPIAHFIGGISDADLRGNVALVAALRDSGSADLAPRLAGSSSAHAVAIAMTWWTLAIEAALAISWLAWGRLGRPGVRLTVLIVFCIVTYMTVPVTAFAAVLLTMALATTAVGDRSRLWLIAAFAVLAAWAPIWSAMFGPV